MVLTCSVGLCSCSPILVRHVTNEQVCHYAGGTVCSYVPGQQQRDDDVRSAVLAETRDLASAEQDASGPIISI